MIALGVDVSSTKIAVAGLRDDGTVTHHAMALNPDSRGARRLREARGATWAVMDSYRKQEACVAAVEIPWASSKGGSSFVLLSIAAVALEATQAALPGAAVLEMPTPTWKKESVGHGNASKSEVLEHAQGLGYMGEDQDIADALCLAQAAGERWHRTMRNAA